LQLATPNPLKILSLTILFRDPLEDKKLALLIRLKSIAGRTIAPFIKRKEGDHEIQGI
jgi:hypothetical protein